MADLQPNTPTAPPPKREGMSEDELLSTAQLEILDALGGYGDSYSQARRDALNRYYGKTRGDERPGQSSVVTRDVFEEVEWALPALMEIFTAGPDICEFEGEGPEDDDTAKQATEACNYVFSRQNPGFVVLQTMFKDALIQKNGVVKVFWDETESATYEEYEGKTSIELAYLVEDEDLEITEMTPRKAEIEGVQIEVYDIRAKRINRSGKCRVVNVPPEEFLITRHSSSIREARFVGHRRTNVTESELIEMGHDPALVRSLPSSGGDIWTDTDQVTRSGMEDSNVFGGLRDDSERTLVITECYMNVDFDGDGISELRRVVVAGDGTFTMLSNDPWDEKPFASVTPCPIPHRYHGMSLDDMAGDLQEIHTTIWRQFLQSNYLANNPRHAVLSTGDSPQANLDQLLSPVPGGYVEEFQPGAIRDLATGDAAATALPAMDKIRELRESRTGISRFDAGVDPNMIHKTADGMNRVMSGKAQRLGLIARNFAETGVKDIFRLIYACLQKHQTQSLYYRLSGAWVPADPGDWKSRLNATISVGLGHGSRGEKVQNLAMIAQYQEKALQGGTRLVTEQNLYATAKELTAAAGFNNPDKYWTDPETIPPTPPEPTPAEQAIEAQLEVEMQKIELDREKLILERAKEELKHEREVMELRLKYGAEVPFEQKDFSLGAPPPQPSAPQMPMPPIMPGPNGGTL